MNRIQRQIVLDALDEEYKLTEWESEFINKLAEVDEKEPGRLLSAKQNAVLNRIGHKLNGGSSL